MSAPAFVLTMAHYGGTLAAARSLGDHGVPVIMADARRLGPALWSRHVVKRERCPHVRPIDRFIDWLIAFGKRDPGHVLYATCDDLAWVFAARQEDLSAHFRLLTPPLVTTIRLLDKGALHEAAQAVGLETPWTRVPADDEELRAIAREAPFPVMVKPRTQVLFESMRKGIIIESGTELEAEYRAFVQDNGYGARLLTQHPEVERPMVQAYLSAESIYCISGFCDPRHGLFVTRAARKLVQWPRRAGIGICFEDAPVDENLATGLRRLCETTGYFGAFEAEFVVGAGTTPLLIDFNPRFFGQMGFDTARALPSAYLVYLAAVGDIERLRAEVEAARAWRAPGRMLFVSRASLLVTHLADRLVGRVPADVFPRGIERRTTSVTDFTVDRHDWVPGVVDGVLQLTGAVRHAPSILRWAARGT